jgi:hypothetical protein
MENYIFREYEDVRRILGEALSDVACKDVRGKISSK